MSQGSSSLKATCQITFLLAQGGQSFFLFSPSTRQSVPTEDNLCYPKFTNLNVGHVCEVASVMSNSVHPYGQQPARFLYPWDSSGKNTGAGCCVLIQGIFPTQGSNPGISFKFPALPLVPPGKLNLNIYPKTLSKFTHRIKYHTI